jgi:exportin-1
MAVEENVKTKWAILGKEQKDGIKKYIVGLVVSIAENPEVVRLHKNILSKGNSILVQIVKQEWDNVWPSAVKDLAEACGQSQALCENNLEILIMLSEEIFEDTKQTMVSAQLNRLKLKYCDNVKIIYDLCEKIGKMYIQDPSKISPSLIKVCVKALYSFLSWAPASYIFMTDLLDGILIGLLPDPKLTVQVLQCCTDCFNISLNDFSVTDMNTSKAKIFNALQLLVARLVQIFPNNRRFREERIEKLKNHNQLTLFDNATKEIALMFTGRQ